MSKVCAKCGIEKDNSEFRLDNKSKDKLGCWCKECDKEYKRIYYHQNKDKINGIRRDKYKNDSEYKLKQQLANKESYIKHKSSYRSVSDAYRNELQVFVDNLKTPCCKCGETRLWLLQFHHVDPKEKLFQIQATHSKEKLEEEAKKCVCLCANCHTEYHHFFGKKPKNPKETLEAYLGEDFKYESNTN